MNLPNRFRFGRFQLLPIERQLLDDGRQVALGARAFDLLLALIERRNRLVSKNELLDVVWPGLMVEEANLPVQVSGLRKLIGPQAIATVPGRGYRFAMPLEGDEIAPPPDEAPQRAPSARTNVPAAIDILIGRDVDVDELPHWIADHRLVTVLGPGGIGKTRLAQAVARAIVSAFRDGVWWVDLAALASADKIALAIASAAHLPLGDGDAPAQLVHALARCEMLLVLDNCEHLADEVARLVRRVLQGAVRVRVLTTSQEALRVDGERLYLLSPLAMPPLGVSLATARDFAAVQLLEHRARAADPHFSLSDSTVARAIDICRQLDGVPLAIEMAAARLPFLGVQGLHERLGERLTLLRTGSRDAPNRQQTLCATLDWSHGLLDLNERAVLRRLAVFEGSFRLDAAQQTAALESLDTGAVLDTLSGLVDKSLVMVEHVEPPRYRLAQTTRLYAWEQLRGAGEVQAVLRRYVGFMREFLEQAYCTWLNTPETAWRHRTEPEVDNLRIALDWALAAGGDHTAGIAIAATALPIWLCRDAQLRAEGLRYARQAVGLLTPAVPVQIEARLAFALALLLPDAPLIDKRAALDHAVDLARTSGSRQDLCHSLVEQARLLARMGLHSDADLVLDEAESLLDRVAHSRLRGLYFMARGLVRQGVGDLNGASYLHGQAAELFSSFGAESLALCALNNFADAAWAQGDLDRAIDGFARAVELARRYPLSSADTVGVPLGNWAAALFEQGNVEQGFALVQEALVLLRYVDKAWELCDALALRLVLMGRLCDAARVQGFVDAAYQATSEARQPNEKRLRERVLGRLRETLDERQLQQLRAAGALLSEDAALCIAM